MYRQRTPSVVLLSDYTTDSSLSAPGKSVMSEAAPWFLSITDTIAKLADDRKRAQRQTPRGGTPMFLVPGQVWRAGKEDYRVQIIHFGLYNRGQERMSQIDKARINVVDSFMELMNISWDDLCRVVVGSAEDAQKCVKLYDEGVRDSRIQHEVARSVLTLDAVFLTIFLSGESFSELRQGQGHLKQLKGFRQIFNEVGVAWSLHQLFSDVWLVQNQIPLALIRNVLKLMDSPDALIEASVIKALRIFKLPHAELDQTRKPSFQDCQHLLECLYRFICPVIDHNHSQVVLQSTNTSFPWTVVGEMFGSGIKRLSGRSSEELPKHRNPAADHLRPNSLLTVSELRKAGIRVKGVKTNVVDITFKRSSFHFTAVLYLPSIHITVDTRRILRNLCAYELGKSTSANDHKLISYLSVLDDLINTVEDVSLLRKMKDPVLSVTLPGEDPDQQVANLVNNLLLNYSDIKLTDEVRTVHDHIRATFEEELRSKLARRFGRVRHEVGRFVRRFKDRPWILFSLIAAIALLIMTALQTVYSLLSYYGSP